MGRVYISTQLICYGGRLWDYNYRGFGHIVKNCRNRGTRERIRQGKRLEYRRNKNNRQRRMIKAGNRQNNLNKDWDLIVLNWVSIIIINLQYLVK